MRSGSRPPIVTTSAFLLASSLAAHAAAGNSLAAPEDFASISNVAERSAALFTELGKVLTSPRCLNCHPAGDRPRQGDGGRLHQPPVFRGADGFGVASMRCGSCHGAPISRRGACPAIRHGTSRRRNELGRQDARRDLPSGQRSRTQWRAFARRPCRAYRQRHAGRLGLGSPAYGRTPAPGTQKEAGRLVEAWIETGAACPNT